MWIEFLNETLLPALLTVMSAAITALVGVAVSAVQKWAKYQKAEWIGAVMLSLTEAAKRAVLKTNQVFVDDMRAAMVDGELTLQDRQAAFELAKRTMMEQIGPELYAALQRIVGGPDMADQVIGSLIESQVAAVKDERVDHVKVKNVPASG